MRRRAPALVLAVVIAALAVVPAISDAGSGSAPTTAAQNASAGLDRAAGEGGRGTYTPGASTGKPEVVRVGALVNDIQELNLETHSYTIDLYLWFKWDDPKINPTRSFEWMNAFELWGHIRSHETKAPVTLRDGSLYQVVREQGKFNTKLPLEDYPFDTQHLLIELEDQNLDVSGLVYKPDRDPIALTGDITLPGWDIGTPTLRVVDNTYATNFGDPSLKDPTYSRVVIDVPVARPKGTYALKLLLPMLLVALTAALALSVHPRFVEGRIGIGITALLTLVALQLTSNSDLPEVNYLILLDKLYILSYAFAVLTLAVIVRNSWVDATGDIAKAVRADRIGLAGLTILYFLGAAILFIQSFA